MAWYKKLKKASSKAIKKHSGKARRLSKAARKRARRARKRAAKRARAVKLRKAKLAALRTAKKSAKKGVVLSKTVANKKNAATLSKTTGIAVKHSTKIITGNRKVLDPLKKQRDGVLGVLGKKGKGVLNTVKNPLGSLTGGGFFNKLLMAGGIGVVGLIAVNKLI